MGPIINSGQAPPSPIATIRPGDNLAHFNYENNLSGTTTTVAPVITERVTAPKEVNIQHTNLLDTGSLTVTSSPPVQKSGSTAGIPAR